MQMSSVTGHCPSERYVNMFVDPAARPIPDAARIQKRNLDALSGDSPILNIGNSVFLTNITFGGEPFNAVIDTGSSDTWLIGDDYKCLDGENKNEIALATCKFGRTYKRTSTFQQLPDVHFNISYVDGERLTGILGRERVTLGGIMVQNQTVAVVDRANWHGDGTSSGLIGLAWPSITQAVQGAQGPVVQQGPVTAGSDTKTNKPAKIAYDPVFFTMKKQGLVEPYFSMAINRPEEGPGVLALGGLPGGDIKYESNFTKAPMEYMTFSGKLAPKSYSLYMVKVTGGKVGNETFEAIPGFDVVIDSGTTLAYLPAEVAGAINDGWNPPALYDVNSRQFFVDCDSKAPDVSLKIGDGYLRIDPADMKLPGAAMLNGKSICISTIQQATGLNLLGGPFMKSVVSVFDVGAAEMRFANRIR